MTAMKTRLATAALGVFGLLVATGCTSQAALASGAQPATAQPATAQPAATSPSASHPCGTESKPGTYKHVIWIWLENHSYGAILGSSQAPYFNTLAKECAVATNYPSQPAELHRRYLRSFVFVPAEVPVRLRPEWQVRHVGEEHLRPGRVVEVLRGVDAVDLRP